MQEYHSIHTQEKIKAFQWNGADEAFKNLDIPVILSEPNSGSVQLNAVDGHMEMHMGYYFIQTEKGWMGLNSDAFQSEFQLLAN